MTRNLYYEYRKWNFFWGLSLDQEKEVQSVIDEFNGKGWKVKDFEWSGFPKLPFLRMILILLVTAITLGFCSFWTGFLIIFESTTDLPSGSPNSTESNNQKGNSTNNDIISVLIEMKSLGIISESEYNEKTSSIEINKKINEHLSSITNLLKKATNVGAINTTEYDNIINKIVAEETAKLRAWQKRKPTVSDISSDLLNQLPQHIKEQLTNKINEFSDYQFASKFVLVYSKNKLQFIERERWDHIIKDGQSSNYMLLYLKK